jgi:hypothetical protein
MNWDDILKYITLTNVKILQFFIVSMILAAIYKFVTRKEKNGK